MIYLKNEAKSFIKKFLFADLLLAINCFIHIFINGPCLNLYFDNNFFYYIYFEKFKNLNYIFHYYFLNALFCVNYVFGYSFIIFLPFFVYFFFKNRISKMLALYFHFLSVELWLGYSGYCSGYAVVVNYCFEKYFLHICYASTVISVILFFIECLTFRKPQENIIIEIFSDLDLNNEVEDDESEEKKIELVTKNLNNPKKISKIEIFDDVDKSSHSFVKNSVNLPSVGLLTIGNKIKVNIDCEKQKQSLVGAFADFGISIEVVDVFVGPVVTLYSIEIAPGIKASRVISLSSDIARLMYAYSVRISTVPGKNLLGVEISNPKRQMVYFKEGMISKIYNNFSGNLPLYLGCNIYGNHEIFDLSTMPHLLVAGTTGSGKSVGIHTMLFSLLYKKTYEEVKLILIDPKKLELTPYEEIPHLLLPVVTEAKKAIQAVRWVVDEMERRYFSMSKLGVRNIISYNEKIKTLKKSKVEEENFEKIPYIVVVVDEMADLMLVVGKEFEMYIQRLAQMGRAAGIHMIIATQRPSVDVITGTIKSNFPTRISFKLSSKIDSRTILGDMSGAEQLLGSGDMLHLGNSGKIIRVHGSYVSEEDVFNVVSWLRSQAEPKYIDLSFEGIDGDLSDQDFEDDPYYEDAIILIRTEQKVSTSFLQRCFPIGYNRAAKLIERMEKQGIITKGDKFGRNREIIE